MSTPAELLTRARLGAGLSQDALAARVGINRTQISHYERGQRQPSATTFLNLLAATGNALSLTPVPVPPAERLAARRDELLAVAGEHHVTNIRVFGSVARGQDTPGSDIDLLVDLAPGGRPMDVLGFQAAAEKLLGAKVDVVEPGDLRPHIRDEALRDARPL